MLRSACRTRVPEMILRSACRTLAPEEIFNGLLDLRQLRGGRHRRNGRAQATERGLAVGVERAPVRLRDARPPDHVPDAARQAVAHLGAPRAAAVQVVT